MSRSYDLYSGCIQIAKDIVRKSDGMAKFHGFDAEQVIKDVREAEKIYIIAKDFWIAQAALGQAKEKVNAARLLEVDEYPHVVALEAAQNEYDRLLAKMEEVEQVFTRKPYITN
jgi:hypothetical protein